MAVTHPRGVSPEFEEKALLLPLERVLITTKFPECREPRGF